MGWNEREGGEAIELMALVAGHSIEETTILHSQHIQVAGVQRVLEKKRDAYQS